MRRRVIFFISVLLLLLVAVPGVLALVHIDSDGQVPFYARAPRDGLIRDGEWVVVVFYRPASCIPADFNLLDFFDFPGATGPGAFGCNPPTTDSHEIWENGPGIDFAPLVAKFRGLGAVPIWFVRLSDMEAAIADDVLTIGELESLPSLRKGSDDYYRETLHPGESNPDGGSITFTGFGELEGGRPFRVFVSLGLGNDRVRIAFR